MESKTCFVVMMSPPWADYDYTPSSVFSGDDAEKRAKEEVKRLSNMPANAGYRFNIDEVYFNS